MYRKVVVPLDGSDLSELTLSHISNVVANSKNATVYLVSVTDHIRGKVSRVWDLEDSSVREFHPAPQQRPITLGTTYSGALFSSETSRLKDMTADLGRMAKTAFDYLSRKSDELRSKGLSTEIRVLIGEPAEEILHFAKDEGADLIVMATSSKAGHGRWAPSVIAEKVVKGTETPILLVKPKADFKETRPRRRGKAT